MTTGTERVTTAIMDCEGVAFDGCHKVYILMDKEQVEKMRGYGYGNKTDFEKGDSRLVTTDDVPRSEMFMLVKDWYRESCMLKFITSVATDGGDDEFGNVISQEQRWVP